MKRKTIIFHCGAPKTGTTSIQFFLERNRRALEENKIFFPSRLIKKGIVHKIHNVILSMKRQKKENMSIKELMAIFSDIFSEKKYEKILISNESIFGEPFLKDGGIFFPNLEKIAECISEIQFVYDVKIIFFYRKFDEYIVSYYGQYVKMGGTKSFQEYFEGIDVNSLSWYRVISFLIEKFGRDNVIYINYKDFNLMPESVFRSAFSNIIPSNIVFNSENHWKNASYGIYALTLFRYTNRIIDRLPNANRTRIRRWVRGRFYDPIGKILPKKKTVYSQDVTKNLENVWQRDANKISQI